MRKIYFIYPKFGSTITGGTLYDVELCKYLKKNIYLSLWYSSQT